MTPECPHCHEPGRMSDRLHAVCENKDCSMIMWRVES